MKKKIATFQEGITVRKKEIEEAKLAIAKEGAELSKLKNEEKILKERVQQLKGKFSSPQVKLYMRGLSSQLDQRKLSFQSGASWHISCKMVLSGSNIFYVMAF